MDGSGMATNVLQIDRRGPASWTGASQPGLVNFKDSPSSLGRCAVRQGLMLLSPEVVLPQAPLCACVAVAIAQGRRCLWHSNWNTPTTSTASHACTGACGLKR
jgi:hypothetical protein